MALKAIITAGGPLPDKLRRHSPWAAKALLELNGRSLLDIAQHAVATLESVEAVCVVGDADVRVRVLPQHEYHAAGMSLVDNIYRGFTMLGGEAHDYLLLSPDLAFLETAALAELIAACSGHCELGIPYVTAEDFLARFPGAPNKYVKLDGRPVTMASCIYCSGRMIQTNIPLWTDFIKLRKAPHRLAALMGFGIAFDFLAGRLSLMRLQRRAEQLMGGKVRGIRIRNATLAYDVDSESEYLWALEHLRAGLNV